jgi:hypothetical protein
MKTKLFVAVFALLAAIISVPTSATATTYTYTGNTFNLTHIRCPDLSCFPATVPAVMSISVTLNFDSANASGSFDVSSGIVSAHLVFTSGVASDDVLYPPVGLSPPFDSLGILLTSGLVTGWSFLEQQLAGANNHQISSSSSGDLALINTHTDSYSGRAGPGTWSSPISDQFSEVPLPGALPLFATGVGALGLLGWRRKRKAQNERSVCSRTGKIAFRSCLD